MTGRFQFPQRTQAAADLRSPAPIAERKMFTGLAGQCGTMGDIALRKLISDPGERRRLIQGPFDLVLYIHATTLLGGG